MTVDGEEDLRPEGFEKRRYVIAAAARQDVAQSLGLVPAEAAVPSSERDEPLDIERRVAVEDLPALVVEVIGDEREQASQLPCAGVDVVLEVGVRLPFFGLSLVQPILDGDDLSAVALDDRPDPAEQLLLLGEGVVGDDGRVLVCRDLGTCLRGGGLVAEVFLVEGEG